MASAKLLGTIRLLETPANLNGGDADGKALYITARTGLYRLRMNVAGSGPNSRNEEAFQLAGKKSI